MTPTRMEITGTVTFCMAVLHTFLCSRFQHLAHKFPHGSLGRNTFHLLGEVEVVFGLWAGILFALVCVTNSPGQAVQYVESLNFTEPLFVFAIMAVAATRPVIDTARNVMLFFARLIPLQGGKAAYFSCLTIGPLLGSFITEPAAMTVTALILRARYFHKGPSERFRYLTLAILFVNVSIGGVLTHFAAPPVLMVASKWKWETSFMLSTFGWKAVIAVLLNGLVGCWLLGKELVDLVGAEEGTSTLR